MNDLINQNAELTMSSREIAELTGKQHKHVLADTRKMLIELDLSSADFSAQYKDASGKLNTCFNLPRRECDILVAGYSIKYRAKIVDRWRELEGKQKPSLPSVKELAYMVIKAEEEKEAALIEVDRLQGVCQTITAQFAKGTTAPKFTKQFNGVNTQQVNNALIDLGLLRRASTGIVPTSYARDKYFIEKQDEHNGKMRSYSTLTLAGAKWLYRAYLSSKLPMKKTWNGSFVHVVFEG